MTVIGLSAGEERRQYSLELASGSADGPHTLVETEKERDLRVLVVYKFKFESHIQAKINKANQIVVLNL